MKTDRVTITPKMAQEFLEADEKALANGKQPIRHRNISGYTIANYVADLETGDWPETHQGILICDTGEIIDGRHRFMAIVKADIPMVTQLTNGISEKEARKIILHIDAGRPRNAATQLWLAHGIENTRAVVAAIRAQWGVAVGRSREHGGSTAAIAACYKMQGETLDQIILILTERDKKMSSSIIGPLAYWAYSNPKEAGQFAVSYATGEHLTGSSPVLWLRRTMDSRKTKKLRHRIQEACYITCNALLAYAEGRRVSMPFRAGADGREWLIKESAKLTSVLAKHAPKAVKRAERMIPMGEK